MEANNAAKMREALCEIVLLCRKVGLSIHGDVACGIIASKAHAALAAPPRNCDNYITEAEAKSAFLAYWNKTYETDYDIGDLKHNVNGITQNYAEWLMEGATDGK